jgi:hypothetical protein
MVVDKEILGWKVSAKFRLRKELIEKVPVLLVAGGSSGAPRTLWRLAILPSIVCNRVLRSKTSLEISEVSPIKFAKLLAVSIAERISAIGVPPPPPPPPPPPEPPARKMSARI